MNSAFAALLGALIGGVLSVVGAWWAQQVQRKSKLLLKEISRRQKLYGEFTNIAAECFGSALRENEVDFTNVAKLFAKLGQMRLHSSDAVMHEANAVAQKILNTYPEVNRTEEEIRRLLSGDSLRILADFGNACRAELAGLRGPANPASLGYLK